MTTRVRTAMDNKAHWERDHRLW